MAKLLLVDRAMQEPTELPRVTERDLEEVLLSLFSEAELHAPPKRKREREDSTQIHLCPPRD